MPRRRQTTLGPSCRITDRTTPATGPRAPGAGRAANRRGGVDRSDDAAPGREDRRPRGKVGRPVVQGDNLMHASRNDDSGRDRQDNAATLLVCANLRAALARFKGDPEVDAWLARVAN